MSIDFMAINIQRKLADKILETSQNPEEFQKAIKQREVTEMSLRFVIKDLLRKKTVESTSGEKVYLLYTIYAGNDYINFLDYLNKIRKGDLEKLCMSLRACRDKE